MESQQHDLCDVTEILMDLRRLVTAHGEFLANFRHHTLTEEPPDSLDERSPSHPPWHTRPPDQQPVAAPPRCWTIPPSITQPPLAVKAEPFPRRRLDPPRFDGDNAQDWIHKIQNYYNNQYMPLHDRLYLTQYLFDHPASEWMAYWEDTNKGKGWDEFLIDVRQRFEPDSHDEYVGSLPALHQTGQVVAVVQGASPRPAGTSRDDRQDIHNTTSPVQVHVQDIIGTGPPPPLMEQESFEANSRDSPQARDFVPNIVVESENIVVEAEDVIFNGPFDSGQPAAIIAMEEIKDVDSDNGGGLQGVARPIRGFTGDATGLLDPYYNGRSIPRQEGLPNQAIPNSLRIFVPSITNSSRVEIFLHWLFKIDDGVLDLYYKGFKEPVTSCTSFELQQDEKAAIIVAANSTEREGRVFTSAAEQSSKVVNAFFKAAGDGGDTGHLTFHHSLGSPTDHAVESSGKDVKAMCLTDVLLEKYLGDVGDGVLLGKLDGEILISPDFVYVSACVADVVKLHYYADIFFNLLPYRLHILSRAFLPNLVSLLLESRPWAFESVIHVVVLAYLPREAVVHNVRPLGEYSVENFDVLRCSGIVWFPLDFPDRASEYSHNKLLRRCFSSLWCNEFIKIDSSVDKAARGKLSPFSSLCNKKRYQSHDLGKKETEVVIVTHRHTYHFGVLSWIILALDSHAQIFASDFTMEFIKKRLKGKGSFGLFFPSRRMANFSGKQIGEVHSAPVEQWADPANKEGVTLLIIKLRQHLGCLMVYPAEGWFIHYMPP